MELLKMFLAAFTVFGLAFVLINLRYWIAGKEFRGTCASSFDPGKGEGQVCSMCGRKPGEECAMPEVKEN